MHRLFVAIRPPPHIRDALIDTMEGVEGARWQSDEQLHLTLRFIGEVERPLAEDVAVALGSVRFDPFALTIAGVGMFDKRGRPNAIWAGIEPCRPLGELQHRVETACRRAGLAPETRKFLPHVTIARLNTSTGALAGWLSLYGKLRLPPFTVEHFVLCESEIGRHGSIYHDIARYG